MRHGKRRTQFSKTSTHRNAMLANLAQSLLQHEQVITTTPRAKAVRPVVEKLITLGKRGDLSAKRQVAGKITEKAVVRKLFSEISERYKDRNGGYVRIVKYGYRYGDNAPLSVIQLIND